MGWLPTRKKGLTLHPEWMHEAWVALKRPVEIHLDGWDTMRLTLAGVWPESSEGLIAAMPPDGDDERGWVGWKPFPEENFWCQGISVETAGPATYHVECRCLGVVGTKAERRIISGASEVVSAENIRDPDGGPWKKHQADLRGMEVEIMWASLTLPDTEVVGTRLTPTNPPEVAANPYHSLTDPTKHYPWGWILASRGLEKMANANAWLVRDRYRYQDMLTP